MARNGSKLTTLNQILWVNEAVIADKGEDAYAYSFQEDENYGMLAVFDGCGGLGARQYKNCGGHTAAYIASRTMAGTVLRWFEDGMPCSRQGMYAREENIAASLKNVMDEDLARLRGELDVEGRRLSGSMIRSFPTTASIILVDGGAAKSLNCLFLWAGDSRGYILQPSGLMQCTRDDLRSQEDAFENLYGDSPLSNMVHGDGNYEIHAKRLKCTQPAILISSTDGTFGYLPSPMHYEHMLLYTMLQADSFVDWQKRLRNAIVDVAGDDNTLVMAVYGWKSFQAMQASFEKRCRQLECMLHGMDTPEQLAQIWQQYKTAYSVYLK